MKHRSERPTEQWVHLQFTNPFTIGGKRLTEKRYKVQASTHKTGDVKFGIYQEQNKKYTSFELTTGGRMLSGESYTEVLQKVRRMVPQTPDFAEQMSELGNILALEEISTAEAHRILNRG